MAVHQGEKKNICGLCRRRRLKLFVYDIVTRIKQYKIDLTATFDQVQDIKNTPDSRTLLLSAVKNGHAYIYTYNIQSSITHQPLN